MRILRGLLRLRWFMQTTRKQWLYIIIGLTFGHLLMGAKPLAAQDVCKLVLDATMKVFDTPSHSYATMTIGGNPQTGEGIYAGGKIYVKVNGKWISAGTTQEMKAMAEKNRQNNKTTCRYVKDELVGGEMAAVYSVHEVTPKGTTDSKTWISKTKGLPLRSDIDLAGGTHMSTRYEYGNVKPPM